MATAYPWFSVGWSLLVTALWLLWVGALVFAVVDMVRRYRRRQLHLGVMVLLLVVLIGLPFIGLAVYFAVWLFVFHGADRTGRPEPS